MYVLQTEGKARHQQKDYSSFYCDACLIVVAWNELAVSLRYTYNQSPPLPPPRKINVSGEVIWSIQNLQVSILQ